MKKVSSLSTNTLLPAALLILPTLVQGQSTPAEFAEMSLTELFQVKVDEREQSGPDQNKWIFSYQYRSIEFDGYKDGDSSLSLDEVLWAGPGSQRTDKNFPVVPTVIKQKVHLLGMGYDYSNDVSFSLSLPYIKQSTDHISIVPGYDHFLIDSSGIGDLVVSSRYQFIDTDQHNWWFSVGLSLPTGSIDEQGDTPRAPGDQQLPYTMQLGSGTYDIPLEFSYHRQGENELTLSMSTIIRTGKNDRDYRLGNTYRIAGKYWRALSPTLNLSIGIEGQYIDKIHGRDDEILAPTANPYPASITNPALYGGKKLVAELGFKWQIASETQMLFEVGKPVYQNLNGPQPGETWRSSLQITTRY